MRGRRLAWCFGLACVVLLLGVAGAVRSPAADPKSSASEPDPTFGPTTVLPIHLEIPAREYQAMQPAVPGGPGFGAPQAPARRGQRDGERNLFGTEFPWAEAKVTVGDQAFPKVGVRYDGGITYFVSGRGLKRPLAVQLDKFADQDFRGIGSLKLHAMPLDPAKAREVLAFSAFRAAGVPSPKAAFAEVTLTVPGQFDRAYLGLYAVVEGVDGRFLADRFGSNKGLLMDPFGIRGVDFLGDDWADYQGRYRPQRDATDAEAKRVIEFARLVNQAGDDEFRERIDSFLNVDAFLRFMAANALAANLEGFFALGHNYRLYLDPGSDRFTFLPGDLEFSHANYLLMGSAEQLMDLSLTKPYPGENKLPDRLLAIPEVNDKYLKLAKDLSESAFAKERTLKDVEAIGEATRAIREKEARATTARREPPAGFGGPGFGPQAPDLKTFADRRAASVAAQLAGTQEGYVPQQFAFGGPGAGPGGGFGPAPGGVGPGRGGNATPIDERTFRQTVQVPAEFEATLFAVPPEVHYPVAIAATPGDEIYVAVDQQGSLGRTPGGGKILRCADRDGDGKADEVIEFAKVEHPRGVCARAGSVWVMHPPTLSVFHDDDGDGVSDRSDVLVTGLTTDQITDRGGDHTTNCVRMGIDGWLYIGVGDYGIRQATGKDGRTISLRGGGVVRVRPDGTELEIYCTGLRNPFDLAIDPFLNVFARDNTNDGGGWDTRVSHLMQTAEYGYPRLFANFTDEIMPTLGTFGGGGGTGGLFIQDDRWPAEYRDVLLTGDWGRSEIYRHDLAIDGPTFAMETEVFMSLPRATGMDIDAAGRLYVASWHGGEASVFVGPNVGFIARVSPKGMKPEPFPDLKRPAAADLVDVFKSPHAVTRLHVQGEILRRGRDETVTRKLVTLASDDAASVEARAAAVFTLKQLDGKDSHPALLKLAEDAAVREFALRALTDRVSELDGLDAAPFVAALGNENPRVRAAALVSLGRLGNPSVAAAILPLTGRPEGSEMPTTRPVQNQPDPDRVIPHLAVKALVSLNAVDAYLAALDGPHRPGALWALRYMHNPEVAEGLIRKLRDVREPGLRREVLATLVRLYHREADYDGSWWGIRPDSTGPYYDRAKWESSDRIGSVVTAAVLDADRDTADFLKTQLTRHRVSLAGVPMTADAKVEEKQSPIVLPKADPNNPNQIGNMAYQAVVSRTLATRGDPARGETLFQSQSCIACHSTADGQTPKGPHLVDIGARYKPEELAESILKPSEKLAQGYETYLFTTLDGRVLTGFVVSEGAEVVRIREGSGVQHAIKKEDLESRDPQKQSAMPDGLAANLTTDQLADLLAYLQSLK